MLFRERLTVPIIWWVLAGLFALSVLLAVGAYLGPVWGVGTSVATLLVAAAIFGSASLVISVDAQKRMLGRPASSTRPRRAAGHLMPRRHAAPLASRPMPELTRCFAPTSRQVEIPHDPDDPVPYWLVSTRTRTGWQQCVQDAASSTR